MELIYSIITVCCIVSLDMFYTYYEVEKTLKTVQVNVQKLEELKKELEEIKNIDPVVELEENLEIIEIIDDDFLPIYTDIEHLYTEAFKLRNNELNDNINMFTNALINEKFNEISKNFNELSKNFMNFTKTKLYEYGDMIGND
jgi:hypothetical protein